MSLLSCSGSDTWYPVTTCKDATLTVHASTTKVGPPALLYRDVLPHTLICGILWCAFSYPHDNLLPLFLWSLSLLHAHIHTPLSSWISSILVLVTIFFFCSLNVQVPWSLYLAAYMMSTSLTVLSIFSTSVTPQSASEAFKLIHITTYLASMYGSRESKYKL